MYYLMFVQFEGQLWLDMAERGLTPPVRRYIIVESSRIEEAPG